MQDITIDVSRATSKHIADAHGVTPEDLAAIARRVNECAAILKQEREEGKYGFYDLYKSKDVFAQVKRTADRFSQFGYENLVILGIGGSALGITALHTALNPPYYNLLDTEARGGWPRLFVMDNIDPDTFAGMLALCPPEKTLYNVISKSGGTAETMIQLLIAMAPIERAVGKDKVKDHLVVTTSPDVEGAPKSLLHPVAREYGCTTLDIPLNVGGRFSVFSPVGLFPAAMLGMDIDAMAEGCAAMDARCQNEQIEENPAYLRAAVQYLMDTEKAKPMSVMMPYSDGLRDVADWYRQLWAESLGKKYNLDGKVVYNGQTPVKALGATDQHSQVQLYREGPNDKLFNIIEVAQFEHTLPVPETLTVVEQLGYLRGQTMNKLMDAELNGTIDALKVSGRPVIRVRLPRVNAHTVAQLLYMLEVETAMAGRLYNVNTFDQPGVEEGKNIARSLMGSGD
ncbi:MAG: glucose-6-phosphate isomerase [Candidatus Hydrogenedentota bacterium]